MLKTLQIVKYLAGMGLTQDEIYSELMWIVDNRKSEYFILTDSECDSIKKIFNDDEKLLSALKIGQMLANTTAPDDEYGIEPDDDVELL